MTERSRDALGTSSLKSEAADKARPYFAATIAGVALYVVLDAVAQSLSQSREG